MPPGVTAAMMSVLYRVVGGLAALLLLRELISRYHRRAVVAKLRRAWGTVETGDAEPEEEWAEAWRYLDAGAPSPTGCDQRTWQDLDLDTVLARLDRTRTGLGTQQFVRRIRTGASWNDDPGLDGLAARFQQDEALRDKVYGVFARVSSRLGYGMWRITTPGGITLRWWYAVFPVLTLASVACILALAVTPRALIPLFVLLLANLVVRMVVAWQLPVVLTGIRQVGPLLSTARRLVPLVRQLGGDVTAVAADLKHLVWLKRIAGRASQDPVVSGDFVGAVAEYLNLLFIVDANVLLFSARQLRRHSERLRRVALWVADVDLACAVARLRAEPRPWCQVARVSDGTATGIWHPLLEHPVSNDAELTDGSGAIITGANMAGKSTYLRSVGVAAVLARAIGTCPATQWAVPERAVRSLIGRNDDLLAGKSYYQVEADGVVALLNQAEGETATLFLLDELLRGTNTVERLAAGEAVLRALLDPGEMPPRHAVVVATHDGELVGMLADLYRPWHFREHITPAGLEFTFRRHAGPATTRTAIALLEASGAPEGLVALARRTALRLDPPNESSGFSQ